MNHNQEDLDRKVRQVNEDTRRALERMSRAALPHRFDMDAFAALESCARSYKLMTETVAPNPEQAKALEQLRERVLFEMTTILWPMMVMDQQTLYGKLYTGETP